MKQLVLLCVNRIGHLAFFPEKPFKENPAWLQKQPEWVWAFPQVAFLGYDLQVAIADKKAILEPYRSSERVTLGHR